MFTSVRGWLLKICHTEGPHTLGEMASRKENSPISVIMQMLLVLLQKQSAIQGSPFFTWVPIFTWHPVQCL